MSQREKSISALFYFAHPESVGNVIVLHTLGYISDHFKTTIYTNQPEFLKKQVLNAQIISVAHIKVKSIPVLGWRSYWKKTAQIINSDESDVVITCQSTAPIAIWLKKPCLQYFFQVQEVIGFGSVTKSLYKRTIQKFIEKYILKGTRESKAIFVVSEPIKAYLETHHVSNLYLTPHCVNLKTFTEPLITDFHKALVMKREEGKFIVCYVGWVSKERGLDLMLEAINMAVKQYPSVFFAIAGSDDSYTRLIDDYAKENRISDNILCFGKIDYVHIPGIIALSNVCLSFLEDNPVYRLSPPQKVIEYFAAGKPVIANNIQTHNLLITDSFDGFIVPFDSDALSEKILFLQSNKDLYVQMCNNAFHTAKKYDTANVYKKLMEIITNMLENGR